MENMFENMDFKRKMSPAEIAMNIPKEYQMMPPEWCAAYLVGYKDGANKERLDHGKPTLEETYPEHFKSKRKTVKNKKQKQYWMMTEETLAVRDMELRKAMIADIYHLVKPEITDINDVCYSAALIASLQALGWREKRVNRIIDSIEKQINELGGYMYRQDDNGIAKWCARHNIEEAIMQRIFVTSKQYKFEKNFGIDDIEIFSSEEQ